MEGAGFGRDGTTILPGVALRFESVEFRTEPIQDVVIILTAKGKETTFKEGRNCMKSTRARLSHELGSERVKERSGMHERSKQGGASE